MCEGVCNVKWNMKQLMFQCVSHTVLWWRREKLGEMVGVKV